MPHTCTHTCNKEKWALLGIYYSPDLWPLC